MQQVNQAKFVELRHDPIRVAINAADGADVVWHLRYFLRLKQNLELVSHHQPIVDNSLWIVNSVEVSHARPNRLSEDQKTTLGSGAIS